jgi:hypothetical protein
MIHRLLKLGAALEEENVNGLNIGNPAVPLKLGTHPATHHRGRKRQPMQVHNVWRGADPRAVQPFLSV